MPGAIAPFRTAPALASDVVAWMPCDEIPSVPHATRPYLRAMPCSTVAPDLRHALADTLDTLASLVAKADSAAYATGLAFGFHSPLGAHHRHCLDHVEALLDGIGTGEIRYDRRERGTVIERDRATGLAAVEAHAAAVRSIDLAALERPIAVLAAVDSHGAEVRFASTVARELLYVLHHTVHHTALMSAQATNMGLQPDPRAGRAPATLAADHAR